MHGALCEGVVKVVGTTVAAIQEDLIGARLAFIRLNTP